MAAQLSVSDVFLQAAVKRMQLAGDDIHRCLDQLSEAQMLHRKADHENSVANLLIHLEGNLRQWFLHGIDGQPDVRDRDAEFALQAWCEASVARAQFFSTLAECQRVIGRLPTERLLDKINPQPMGDWGPMTIVEAIFRIVGHLQLHQGQITLLTKQLAARDLDLSIPRKR
jgi:uncharacterized damage-inducible protein DinB